MQTGLGHKAYERLPFSSPSTLSTLGPLPGSPLSVPKAPRGPHRAELMENLPLPLGFWGSQNGDF